jgi:fucose permease
VPPLLFVTFRELYGISYALLGTLVLVNFFTQLGVDLILTVFSKHFNIKKTVRLMPVLTAIGLCIYAIIPTLFANIAYVGLLIGTVIFSVSAGLSEVLLSPIVASLPSDDPKRDMSTLHSLYAFGTFTMIVISTVFIKLFDADNWMYLVIFLATLPIISAVMFMISPFPEMNASASSASTLGDTKRRAVGLALCLACIFFGSCAENAMANWISTYVENALGISKAVGDILGVAMFAILLGVARISYGKFGKNICRTLIIGMVASSICYVTVGVSANATVALVACALTGFCSAMLWPGTLIMMEEKIPNAGVAAYALMASGGDLGASVAPQLLGIVVDKVSISEFAAKYSVMFNITPEQLGLRVGMIITAIFPIIGTVVVLISIRYFKRGEL